jgi:hypothetical protein
LEIKGYSWLCPVAAFSPFAVSHPSISAGKSFPAASYNPPALDNKPQNGAGHRAFCVACRNFPNRSATVGSTGIFAGLNVLRRF